MDAALGTGTCPALERALGWLANEEQRSNVVVVSNHGQMLKEILSAKLSRRRPSQFNCFLLVYLHKPLRELARDLRLEVNGVGRSQDAIDYTLANHDGLHSLYSALTDQTVECGGKTIEAVASEIRAITSMLD
jgi:hypothetical protein